MRTIIPASSDKRNTIILCSILLIKVVAHFFLINPVYELQRDEYLHVDQGFHLAWGYLSVPPFTSWTSWIIIHSGNKDFFVKLFPALWGAGTIAAGWNIAKAIGGGFFAKMLTAVALLLSVYLRMNTLYQPNSFEIFSWTVIYFFLIKFVYTEDHKWLYWLAVSIALAFLNKYNTVFLCAGIFGGLLLTPQRKIFTNKHFWIAAAICLAMIMPNLFWQIRHHFPVVRHMEELKNTQLTHNSAFAFLTGQLLAFSGSLLIIIPALIAFVVYKPFRKVRFLGVSYLICIMLYIFFLAKNYYAFGLYAVLIATGSVYLGKLSELPKRTFILPVSFILVLVLFIPMRLSLPFFSPENIKTHKAKYQMFGMLHWDDGKDHELPQDFADMLGWKEMAAKTKALYNSLPDKDRTIIVCDNYGEAGAINYYAGLKANSYNADYIFWFDTVTPVKNIIRVSFDEPPNTAYKGVQMFETLTLKDSVSNDDALERTSKIWLLQNNKTDIRKIIKESIAEKIN